MQVSLVSMPVKDPIKAHEIYTTKLGFISKRFEPEAQIAIVVSPDDINGSALLLEPIEGNFLANYQKSAFESDMPIMVFKVRDVKAKLKQLADSGVTIRPELDKPEWEIENVFEDGCGNLLMLEAME